MIPGPKVTGAIAAVELSALGHPTCSVRASDEPTARRVWAALCGAPLPDALK